ncbi:MAG: hypothetical protein AAB458_02645 [Patescibacteria group bacterium]
MQDVPGTCWFIVEWILWGLFLALKYLWLPVLATSVAVCIDELRIRKISGMFFTLIVLIAPIFPATAFHPGPIRDTNWLVYLLGVFGGYVCGNVMGVVVARFLHKHVRYMRGKILKPS